MDEDQKRFTAHQIELEKTHSKNQLLPRIRAEFMDSEAGFVDFMREHDIPSEFGIDLLTHMAIQKRADLPTMVGLLKHHLGSLQETANMLERCAEVDLVDWDDRVAKVFICKFLISSDVQAELDRFQFPLPLVIEPKPVLHNAQSGYYLSSGSILLRNNHHEDDVALDHINRMNSIPLTLNHDVVKHIKNEWRNLDKKKEGEKKEDFQRRKDAFEKYDRCAKDVITLLQQEGDRFFLAHNYCKRGRTYSRGYHVTDQGTPWNKATIEFWEKEVVSGL